MRRLLVVLGHENSEEGKLTETAEFRCLRAAEILESQEESVVVATGAFGWNFNNSAKPHGVLMLEKLAELSVRVREEQVTKKHTFSAFTEEDLFQARRIYADEECDAVTIVTSSYHSHRVTEIAKVVFRDTSVEVVSAPDGSGVTSAVWKSERRGLKRFRERWVDLPLYTKGAEFPHHIYENASAEHKHNDSISLAVVTGALLFSCYPFTTVKIAEADVVGAVLFFACAIVGLGFLGLYARFATFAFLARCVMRGLELGWGVPGFSYNYDRFHQLRWPKLKYFRTSRVLLLMTLVAVTLDLIAAGVVLLN